MNDQTNEQNTGNNKNRMIKRIIWIFVAFTVVISDQLSKWSVTELLFRPQIQGGNSSNFIEWYLNTPSLLPYSYVKITSFFNLVMAWNTGVSFSMFSNSGAYTPYILIVVALGIAGLFAIWLWRATTHTQGICYALIVGGALGNIIDRARFGAVIDFLDLHAFGYHWPAFNIADMAVVTGVSFLIIVSLFFEINIKSEYRKNNKN